MESSNKQTIRLIAVLLLSSLLSACASDPKSNAWRLNPVGESNLQVKQVNSPASGRNYMLCQRCVNYSLVDVGSAFPQHTLLTNK